MKEFIIGLDIGSYKICAVAGTVDKNGALQIMGITSINSDGVKKGIIVDIDSASKAIKECITQIETMVDTVVKEVYIALPGSISELILNKAVVAISSEDREINSSDVKRVISASKIVSIASDKEIIGVIPQQYIVDGYDKIKDPVGMSGLKLEVDAQIITAEANVVNNIFKAINKAGLNVASVVFQPIAISQVAFNYEEKERVTAIIDAGAETIDLSIFKNGNLLWIDSIALGGSTITNDISVCLNLSRMQSERLKTGTLSAIEMSQIGGDKELVSKVIQARIEELFLLIMSKLKLSEVYDEISTVVLVGGGLALFKEIEEFGTAVLGKSVKCGKTDLIGTLSPLNITVAGIVKNAVEHHIKDKETDINYMGVRIKESDKKNRINEKNNKKQDDVETNSFFSKIKVFFTDFF